MQEALNAHVTAELFSANLYLAMSAWCHGKSFKGFGHWLRVQHGEELAHAQKMLDYLVERGGEVNVGPVAAPGKAFGSPLQVFEKVLEHERQVSKGIEELHATAVAERDTAAQIFLQWFVAEQVEEEAHVQEIVDKAIIVILCFFLYKAGRAAESGTATPPS